MYDTKLERALAVLEDRAAFQKDLNRLDSWADWYFQEFSTRSSPLCWDDPMQKHRMGPQQRKLLWRKDLESQRTTS